ncbi:protein of unknown function [Methylorubrum extorquens]|uniref:Uncharacterized protein n=1 Tax=Methylorubrum extorquens TaxID=408 RepID=A0A2N9AHV5_METEX|nr:protein of unknown function [Methylorubrum extorquens]
MTIWAPVMTSPLIDSSINPFFVFRSACRPAGFRAIKKGPEGPCMRHRPGLSGLRSSPPRLWRFHYDKNRAHRRSVRR